MLRQGIVCTVLVLIMPGLAAFGQSRPHDLPLDPRIICPEGPEPLPPPAEPQNAVPAVGAEPEDRPKSTMTLAFGFGHDRTDGVLLLIELRDNGRAMVRWSIPLGRTPLGNLIGLALSNNGENQPRTETPSTRPGRDSANEAKVRALDTEEVDPEYLRMLRSTEPLNLPPLRPATEPALPPEANRPSHDGRLNVIRASYVEPESNEGPMNFQKLFTSARLAFKSGALEQAEMLARTAIEMRPAIHLPSLDTPEKLLEEIAAARERLSRRNTANSDSATNRRDCPRTSEAPTGTILYIDPPPRSNLTIREE